MSNPLALSRATWKLAPEVLLGWTRWDPAVHAYLKNASEVNLRELAAEYIAAVVTLYAWLRDTQIAEHQADIDATNARISELHRLYPFPE